MKYIKRSDVCARVPLALLVLLFIMGSWLAVGCGGGGSPVAPTPTPDPEPAWTSPVFRYKAEAFPQDYLVGKEYQFTLMKSVSDAINPDPNEFVVGLYSEDGALYPWSTTLHMISIGDLYVNEEGGFTALEPGQKTLKVEIRDSQNRLYSTITFGPYFTYGLDWDSPVGRFNIEIEPSQYIVGRFYDIELINSISDIIDRQANQIMIGLYRKSDEGVLFSETLGLKFTPSGNSLYINEFGRFSAESAGEKTVIAEVVDVDGHLYITVIFHPTFVMPDEPPPLDNTPPEIDSYSPNQDHVVLTVGDDPQLFTVTGHDDDGNWFNTWWTLEGDSPVKSGSYNFCPSSVGEWTLKVLLSDGYDQSSPHFWTIEVQEEDEPPPPPVTYNLRVFGTLGELISGGTISVEEGNGILINHWELWPDSGEGDKIFLDITGVVLNSSLPDWIWDNSHGEIITVFWDNPELPNPDDPGNMFINPGTYNLLCFEVEHEEVVYELSDITLEVEDRPDFP